jgi:CRP-like cAMP-binding protein
MTNYRETLLYKKVINVAALSDAGLEKLFNSLIMVHVKKKKNILSEGQVCKGIYFVESGYLRMFAHKDGLEINTGFVFENDFATNLKSLRLAAPSDTTIQAGEDSILYVFEKGTLLGLYNESPEIGSFGRMLLEQLLMAQEEHANLFKIFTPAERYKYLQTNHPQLLQRVSLSQIASYLGVARETLSRIRKIK